MKNLTTAILIFLALTVLTGVIYPLVVTGIAQLVFPHQANGSLIVRDGKAVGSELIGQPFAGPTYFWSRPSATAPFPYNAGASTGSNLGPTNPDLLKRVKGDVERIQAAHPGKGPVPVDLVTSSASGLDPHISPAAAYYQVERVAAARHLDASAVRRLVDEHVEGRTFGFLGEPRVNVLRLNLDLDRLAAGANADSAVREKRTVAAPPVPSSPRPSSPSLPPFRREKRETAQDLLFQSPLSPGGGGREAGREGSGE